jgi:hypothetical protein
MIYLGETAREALLDCREPGEHADGISPLFRGAEMALRFIGIDPETNGGNCPTVWIDDVTGDFVFQGVEVTSGDMLAQIAARSPIPSHEKVVRLPARMRAIIQEAIN